jgi:hypothetical protein
MENSNPRVLLLREKQMLVFNYPARFRVVVAGRRFGKTQLALSEMLRAAAVAGRVVWYIGPSFPQAKRIVWDRLKDFTRAHWRSRPSETDLAIQLDSGAAISVRGADRPDSLRGNSLDFVVLDEFASMRPETWSEVIRPALTDREGRALFLGTPQGCNHFYDLYEQSKTAPDWAGFQFTTAEGGNVRAEELVSCAAQLDPESYTQEFEAAFTGAGRHRVYYAFDRAVHLESSSFQPGSPLVWSLDFNVDPMCMLLMQRSGDTVYVFDEIILKPDANTEAACQAFFERTKAFPGGRPFEVEVYGDSSGYQRRTSGAATDWALIRDFFYRLGSVYRPSIRAASSNPAVRDRINCVNSRLRNALGECHLYVDPRCRELIRDLEQVTWALDATGRPTSDIDKSDRARTHSSDALGYYIAEAFPLRPSVGFQSSGRLL